MDCARFAMLATGGSLYNSHELDRKQCSCCQRVLGVLDFSKGKAQCKCCRSISTRDYRMIESSEKIESSETNESMTILDKTCTDCNKSLPLDKFYKNRSQCKECYLLKKINSRNQKEYVTYSPIDKKLHDVMKYKTSKNYESKLEE